MTSHRRSRVRHPGRRAAAIRDLSLFAEKIARLIERFALDAGRVPALQRCRAFGRDDGNGVASALLAIAVVSGLPAAAQEPDHLERLAGVCRDSSNAVIGSYAGRVLWLQSGELSGMLTRDEDAAPPEGEPVREGLAPRSITVPKQAPEITDGGLVLRSTVVFLNEDGAELGEALVACTVNPTGPVRPDPGATSRG
jgi:hypothetical protein